MAIERERKGSGGGRSERGRSVAPRRVGSRSVGLRSARRRCALASAIAVAGTFGLFTGVNGQPLDCNHPSGVGCFEFTVTGPAGPGPMITGFASAFGSTADQGWYTQLVEPGGATSLMILYMGGSTPPIGEHEIVDYVGHDATPPPGKFAVTGSIDPNVSAILGLYSVSGKLTVTSISGGWIEGTFDYRAQNAPDGQSVNVSGRFKTKTQVM